MRITPRRSTERIASEFLPDLAEMEWIGTLKVKSGDVLLRNIARSCFTGIRPTDDEAQCALNVLCRPSSKRDGHAEALAAWILGFAKPTPDFLEQAQQRLSEAIAPSDFLFSHTLVQFQRAARLTKPTAMVVCSLWMVYVFSLLGGEWWTMLLWGTGIGIVLGAIASVLLTPVVLPFSALFYRRQEKQIQRAALYTLWRWNDPRFIGEVARASIKADSVTMAQVQETFAKLLMQLTPEYYGVMPAGTTESLCRALEIAEERTTSLYWKPDTLTTSIPYVKNLLQALELVGSGQAAKYVRAVVEQNWNEEITKLAMSVLTILSEREQEETARTTLLRHSAIPASADQLLRPAANTQTNDDAQTLMRPIA